MRSVLCVLLTLPGILFAEGGLPDRPYIYVEGKAEIEKPADLVTLRFDVVARNADQNKANQEVQASAGKIFALLDERKIERKDVIADDLRLEPQYQDDENSPRERGKVIGYTATRPFTVRVREIAIFAKLVDDLIAVGGVQFSGIEAGLSKEKQMQDEVWNHALTNARERAEKTLKPTGMTIDSVFAVSPVNFPEIQRRIFGSSEVFVEGAAMPKGAQVNPSQYRLAPVTISQSIHVIYLISPAK
jgi:uncharacterized protein YggE